MPVTEGDQWLDITAPDCWESLQAERERCIEKDKRLGLKRIGNSKTDRQRGYQWGWFYPQASEAMTGAGLAIDCEDGTRYPYTPEILHCILKQHLLEGLYRKWGKPTEIVRKDGKTLKLELSSEGHDMGQFSEYIEAARSFLHECYGVVIPEPQDGFYAVVAKEMRA